MSDDREDCLLCREGEGDRYHYRLTTLPDLPKSVPQRNDDPRVCSSCHRALGGVEDSECCAWCGDEEHLWNVYTDPGRSPVEYTCQLCVDCYKGRKQ